MPGRYTAGRVLPRYPSTGIQPNDAQQQLDIAIGWGRYAELFDYNTHTDQITAEADTEIPASALADGVQ
ncbi:MAG: AAA-associated domain-containing protein [Mycobacterium sp.]